jgi:hypothetical protein
LLWATEQSLAMRLTRVEALLDEAEALGQSKH